MISNTEAPQLPDDPLWTRVRAMFARAMVALGGIVAVAAHATLPRKLRRQVIDWLCPLEHIVRKLLLAQALREPAPKAAKPAFTLPVASTTLPTPQRASKSVRSCDLTRPESWTVRFSFSPPRDPRAVPERFAPRIRDVWGPTPPPPPPPPVRAATEHTPLHLARRFEALRRVLENPLPHAQKLARLIARIAPRFPQFVQRYVFAPARSNGYDPRDWLLGVDAMGAAFCAAAACDTS